MRGLLRDKRSQTLAWMLAMLGVVIILSPLSSLADNQLGFNFENVGGNANITYLLTDSSGTAYIQNGFHNTGGSDEFVQSFLGMQVGSNICLGLHTVSAGTSNSFVDQINFPDLTDNIFEVALVSSLSSSTDGAGCLNGVKTIWDEYKWGSGTNVNLINLSNLISTSSPTNQTILMSTSTDTIVGNVFNQIYLLGWFFFFIIVFWITFKITKR